MKHYVYSFILFVMLLSISFAADAKRVGVYCFFANDSTRFFHDENIRAQIAVTPDGVVVVEVENLSDDIIYIDRGNSFSIINDLSAPLFFPSSSTESHTYGWGVARKNEAGNETWVNGESHSQSHTVYNQRIQPVAPHGIAVVSSWTNMTRMLRPDMVKRGKDTDWLRFKCRGQFGDTNEPFCKGDARYYTFEYTPLSLTLDLQYRIQGEENIHRVHLSDYITAIEVGPYQGVSREGIILQESYAAASNGRRLSNCIAFRSGKSIGGSVGEVLSTFSIVPIFVIALMCSDAMDTDFPSKGF